MDITDLTKNLHAKINTATTTQEILALSKAIERLNIGSVRTVSTYTGLSSLSVLDGEVVFVEDENILYYNFSGYWFKINKSAALSTWSWGINTYGALGDGTITGRNSPVSMVGGFKDWVQVSTGAGSFSSHSMGLRSNGTAWAWGSNSSGQLGDGTLVDKSSPVSVVGGFADWIQLDTSAGHALAIRANGTAWAWGSNGFGTLGDGTTVGKSSPVAVVGGFSDWIQVSAGTAHSLGLRANGTTWAWGVNTSGQLGDNTIVSRLSPVAVVGGFADWVQVSAGNVTSIGLRSNGTAWAWGNNTAGEMGDGTTTGKSSPVAVVGGFTDWVQLSGFSRGVRSNGTAWAWGANSFGQLGDGTTTNTSSPVSIVGGFTDWVRVEGSSSSNSMGIRKNGTIWSWGANGYGVLGDGTTISRSSPVSVVGGFTDWVDISFGGSHALAMRSS